MKKDININQHIFNCSSKEKSDKENLEIDLYILELLKGELLNQNTGYVNINKLVDKSKLEELCCTMGYFRKRVFYNIGLGYISLYDPNDMKLNSLKRKLKKHGKNYIKFIYKKFDKYKVKKDIYYKYFLEVKITKEGLERIDEIKKQLSTPGILKLYLKNISFIGEFVFNTKMLLSFIFTVFLIGGTLIFNSNFTKFLNNIPFAGALIDSELQEEFKNFDDSQKKEDIYFKALKEHMENSDMPFTEHKIDTIKVNTENGEAEKIFKIEVDGKNFYFKVKYKDGKFYLENVSYNINNSISMSL